MTIKLPPKPEMVQIDRHIPTNYVIRGYTAEQMDAHAIEAIRLNMAPLSDEQIEQGRRDTFSTENPFCPCDSKTMRKAVRWAERAHGICKGANCE